MSESRVRQASTVEHHHAWVQTAERVPVFSPGFQQVNQVLEHEKSTLLFLFKQLSTV